MIKNIKQIVKTTKCYMFWLVKIDLYLRNLFPHLLIVNFIHTKYFRSLKQDKNYDEIINFQYFEQEQKEIIIIKYHMQNFIFTPFL